MAVCLCRLGSARGRPNAKCAAMPFIGTAQLNAVGDCAATVWSVVAKREIAMRKVWYMCTENPLLIFCKLCVCVFWCDYIIIIL